MDIMENVTVDKKDYKVKEDNLIKIKVFLDKIEKINKKDDSNNKCR